MSHITHDEARNALAALYAGRSTKHDLNIYIAQQEAIKSSLRAENEQNKHKVQAFDEAIAFDGARTAFAEVERLRARVKELETPYYGPPLTGNETKP